MSGKNTTVSLTLQLKGQQAGQELKKISDQQVQSTARINQQWTQLGSTQAKFVQATKLGAQATVNTARAGDQLLRTNRMLEGVLRQQSIHSKIQSQQLKLQQTSAQATANWMKQVAQSSRQVKQDAQHTASFWQKAPALGGAAVAGGMIVSSALQKPRDYAEQMSYIALTATGGQNLSTSEYKVQKQVLENYVKQAIRTSGGTREDTAAALNELIASGKYETSNVSPALNESTKTAFAAGADAVDASKMTIAMQNFGVKNLALGQDRAMRAGELGSFEYRDLAKFLPEQMSMARASGYSGDDGLVKLLSLNQIAKTTASDSATAGNNVVNLLQKLSSREFSDSIAKAVVDPSGLPTKAIKNKKGKVVGQEFDWATYSIQQRGEGVYGVEAFVKLLERQLKGNAQYTKLQKEAHAAKTPEERKSKLEDMSNIALGSEMGQIIADRQALMAAMAAVYGQDQTQVLEQKLSGASGTRDRALNNLKTEEWVKDQAVNQEKLFAQSKAYDEVSGALGDVKQSIADWAKDNEGLAASAYAASVALTALAAGAGIATVFGGGKGGNISKNIAETVATKSIADKAKGGLGKAGAVAAAYSGYELIKSVDDYLYGAFDKLLGGTGEKKDYVQMTIEQLKEQQAQQNEQIVAEQQQANQYSKELISNVKMLINVTSQNKPINFSPGPLMQSLSAVPEDKRHGAPPAYLLRK